MDCPKRMFEPRGYGKVAETATGPGPSSSTEIAGLVRGCVKTVVSGTTTTQQANNKDPIYTKVGYVLGLRVSPSHRYVRTYELR